MSLILPASNTARALVRRAVAARWKRIVVASLLGTFLAELLVMTVLERLHVRWGLATNLLDAALLTLLILPGLYFVVLRPVGHLVANLDAASSDARFRAVVDATADGILVGDRAGRIRHANPAALRMLGYKAEELLGSEVARLVPEDSRQRHREGMDRYKATGEARLIGRGSTQMEALAKSGERIPVELTLSAPTLREEGLLVAVMRDLRHSRRLGLYEAILPVCCVCGRIRDDDEIDRGRELWGSLEAYVERRASARFSHTFCPECVVDYRRREGLPAAAGDGPPAAAGDGPLAPA